MTASINQKDGLTFAIDPSPASGADVLVVRLFGTDFHAKVEVGNDPNGGTGLLLASFLEGSARALPNDRFEWKSVCEDLSVSVAAEAGSTGLVRLDVSMCCNSEDNCDWHVNGSLSVDPNELREFARAVPMPTERMP